MIFLKISVNLKFKQILIKSLNKIYLIFKMNLNNKVNNKYNILMKKLKKYQIIYFRK